MSPLLSHEAWVVLTGAIAASACGAIGCFLLLRRMAMLGDAISHAVLPGIAVAVLASGSLSGLPVLVGAGLAGLVTSFVVETLQRAGGVEREAAIGITFTALFSVGVLIVTVVGDHVDLDQECVLYGELVQVPFDVLFVAIGGQTYDLGPRAFVAVSVVFALDLAFLALFWKELLISSFDEPMARAVGIAVRFVHYALMGMVSLTVVGAFESVGSVLVVAFLVVPGATAYLLTDRLSRMVGLAVLTATLSAVLGYGLARAVDCSVAAAMSSAAGGLFLVTLLFAPRQGVATRAAVRYLLRLRIGAENLVGEVMRSEERGAPLPTVADLAAKLGWSRRFGRVVRWYAEQRDLIDVTDRGVRLRAAGVDEAKRVRDSHRSWQGELEQLGYDRTHAHASAHRLEHVASPEAVRRELPPGGDPSAG